MGSPSPGRVDGLPQPGEGFRSREKESEQMGKAEDIASGRVPQTPKKDAYRDAWRGFADIPLTEENKAEIKDMSVFAEDLLGIIADMVNDRFKLSFSADVRNNCYVVAATGKAPGDANENLTLTGRGPSLEVAINVLWFKHAMIAEQGAWENVSKEWSLPDMM